MKTNIILLLFTLCIVIISSCKKDNSALFLPPTDQEILESGWRNFMNGSYTEAVNDFTELINREAFLGDAYTGLGWSNSFLNYLQEAVNNYNIALNNQSSNRLSNDIYAGLSFVYDALDYHQNCLVASDSVTSDWRFAYKEDLDYNDLILLRAISFYALGDFLNSLSEIQRLDPSFIADVATIEGRAALADKIEELRSQI